MVYTAMTGTEYAIRVTLCTGTVHNVHATRDTIEGFYGHVNNLIHHMLKPLEHVQRIEVKVYDEILGEDVYQATYDKELEAWRASGERAVIVYDFYGTGMEDEERGYVDVIEGWLPKYAVRYRKQAFKKHALLTGDIVRIESAEDVNKRARNARNIERYYKDPKAWNQACYAREKARRKKQKAFV